MTRRQRQPVDNMDEDFPNPRRKTRERSASRSTSPHRHTLAFSPYGASHGPTAITTVLPKSRWQQLVVGASTAAGTTAAVVSAESMKCLRYCLSWLQYAIQHIDQQIALLRGFLISLATAAMHNNATAPSSDRNLVPTGANARVNGIKKEVIDTLKKVVEIISRYAGACLPEQATTSVKGFILSFPSKLATLQHADRSPTPSPTSSPLLGPSAGSNPYHVQDNARQILTLAGESVDMLRSVSAVFSDTIERAEGWIDRLRYVGVLGTPAGTPSGDNKEDEVEDLVTLPPLRRSSADEEHQRKLPSLGSLVDAKDADRYTVTTMALSDGEDEEWEDDAKRTEFNVQRRRSRRSEVEGMDMDE
ncbi:transcription factor Opi1-domain-containing protein [Jimgerdemannia flammicorona]|uniref:Transcription factor Opi1-domain-containing protein n=1 Tax=Jimgerdemannia flammicorona TaxID=994334 RepID=A0A433QJG5_9FUNG|nr:transcription factor Opi1-domain-containing protein [Jimgerdemannia flammicorona]